MMNTTEMIDRLTVKLKSLLNIVERSLFCTSHSTVAKVCKLGGIFIISGVNVILIYQKLLKSDDFSRSYSKNKRGLRWVIL